MDERKKDEESDNWKCSRCTSENHSSDTKCIHCLTPRHSTFPEITNVPVPEVANPYPERKFTGDQSLPSSANFPARRESIPPERSGFDLESDDSDSNLDELYTGDETPHRDFTDLKSPPIISDQSAGDSELRIPTGNQEFGSASGEGFHLPPFPDLNDYNKLTTSSSETAASTTTTSASATKQDPRKLVTVEDFLSQSANGFGKNDFKSTWLARTPSEVKPLNDPDREVSELELFGQNQSELDESGSNWVNLTPIGSPINLLNQEEEELPETGLDENVRNKNTKSPTANMDTESGAGTPLLEPLSPLALPNELDPFAMASSSNDLPLLHDPEFAALAAQMGASSNETKETSDSSPSSKPVLNMGSLSAEPHSVSVPKLKKPIKKVKPPKSKPVNISSPKPRSNQQLSSTEILSLYDGNDDDDDEPFGTPPSEPPPQIASFRTASIEARSNLTGEGSNDIIEIFDPLAPKRDEPMQYNEDYFTRETPIVQETLRPQDQGIAPSSTASVPVGGARKKTTRPMPSQSTDRPSTSSRPPQSSSVDRSKWSCPLCTYENRISAQYCEICHDGRPPWYEEGNINPIMTIPPARQESSRDTVLHAPTSDKAFVDDWNCTNCSSVNDPSLQVCQSCGRNRPAGFASPSILPLTGRPERNQTVAPAPREVSITPSDMPGTSGMSLSTLHPRTPASYSRQLSYPDDLDSLMSSPVNSINLSRFGGTMMTKVKEDLDKNALAIYKNIEKFCTETKMEFVDDQFRPQLNSLQYPGGRNEIIRNAVWYRPHEIKVDGDPYNVQPWTVFSEEGPQSTDIQQGILGNCWFLSALSVLVERPELLKKIFVTDKYNKLGVYMIRLCKDGVWKTVIIDDLLPCGNDSRLLYTQAIRKQLWVPLIEKALAKVHGCYEALQAGRSIEGLATLTGAPCESLQLVAGPDRIEPECDLIWVRLLSSKEAGFIMGASCGGAHMDIDPRIYENVNLRVRHAYSVLDVRAERTDEGDHVKLLQLRNPWAQQSWSGDWCDNDTRWSRNPRLREKLKPYHSHRGIFWLSFEDTMKYFDSIDICKVHHGGDLSEIRTSGNFPDSGKDPPTSFFLEVTQPTEIDLSIFQQGSRSVEGSGRQPVDLCICVYRTNANAASSSQGSEVMLGPLITSSRRQVKRHGSCCHWFEPGYYHIVTLAFNHWRSAYGSGRAVASIPGAAADLETPKFVLALHSTKPVSISYFKPHPSLLADATIELVMKRGDKKDIRDCATCYYLAHGWAGLIIVAENRHPERHLQIQCDCVESVNVVSTRGVLRTADCVKPLHKQVLVVLTQLDGHSGFTITHKETHRIGNAGLGDWVMRSTGNHDPPLNPEVAPLHEPRPL